MIGVVGVDRSSRGLWWIFGCCGSGEALVFISTLSSVIVERVCKTAY